MTEPFIEWDRKPEVAEALDRIDTLIEKAEIEVLSTSKLLKEIHPNGRHPLTVVLAKLATVRPSKRLRSEFRKLALQMARKSDALSAAEQAPYNRILRQLLSKLTRREALEIVRAFVDHRFKGRRDLAYSVFRWAAIDRDVAERLLARYARTQDERMLKILVSAKGSGLAVDLLRLLSEFGDRYWRMRVLQAALAAGQAIPNATLLQYPTEFLQAMARIRHRPSVPTAKKLLRRNELRSSPTFLAFYAWAMYTFGEFREVLSLRSLAASLREAGSFGDSDRKGKNER